ncbi:MAG: rRNA maturation RNase YbeY [gamma proteobacterium symbiont of Phacoides pectinatus]
MNIDLTVQHACGEDRAPDNGLLTGWVAAALEGRCACAELTIRIVGEEESRELNRRFRHRDRPTNVLSFPSDLPAEVESDLLGDLVICAAVVEREALQQEKPPRAHWAHMVVHGVLHLIGHDHQNREQAALMEGLEREILEGIGYPDPYREERGG